MIGVVYLLSLVVALIGMLLIDRRFRLFFWRDARSASIVTIAGVLFFLAWDAAGIAGGIFLRGDAVIATGIVLAPELPLEEVFFLVLLCWLTMNLLAGSRLLLDAFERRRAASVGISTGGDRS